MADGDWSEYVASAGSDPAPLAGVADDMGDALAVAQPELESIDTSALTDQAAEGVDSATYDAGQAASWQQWSEGDLASAGSWQDQAAGHSCRPARSDVPRQKPAVACAGD
jgi:hypothetical protein